MSKPKTSHELKTFDDTLHPFDIKTISDLEQKLSERCPYLKKVGESYFYCSIDVPKPIDLTPVVSNPVYQSHVTISDLQTHCMSDFKNCIYFSGKTKRRYWFV